MVIMREKKIKVTNKNNHMGLHFFFIFSLIESHKSYFSICYLKVESKI